MHSNIHTIYTQMQHEIDSNPESHICSFALRFQLFWLDPERGSRKFDLFNPKLTQRSALWLSNFPAISALFQLELSHVSQEKTWGDERCLGKKDKI